VGGGGPWSSSCRWEALLPGYEAGPLPPLAPPPGPGPLGPRSGPPGGRPFQKGPWGGPLPPGGPKVEVEAQRGGPASLSATYRGARETPSFLARFLEKGHGGCPSARPFLGLVRQETREALKGQAPHPETWARDFPPGALPKPIPGPPSLPRRRPPESAFGQRTAWSPWAERGPFFSGSFPTSSAPTAQRLAREGPCPALKGQGPQEGGAPLKLPTTSPSARSTPRAPPPPPHASECAQEQGGPFWPYHDLLMAGRLGDYLGLARAPGPWRKRPFARCLQKPGGAESGVEEERALGPAPWGPSGKPPRFFAGALQGAPTPLTSPRCWDYLELAPLKWAGWKAGSFLLKDQKGGAPFLVRLRPGGGLSPPPGGDGLPHESHPRGPAPGGAGGDPPGGRPLSVHRPPPWRSTSST
jgi:hypothetical protein